MAACSACTAVRDAVVGFVNAASPKSYAPLLSAFLKGLNEAGFVDGHNVSIEYRWAEGRVDQLPAMVADLVHRRVAVIAATGTPAALAVRAATTTIPTVFETAADPVRLGLVASLNQPGANVTGVTSLLMVVGSKRLELLHELVPTARVMALLVNPVNPNVAEINSKELEAAARTLPTPFLACAFRRPTTCHCWHNAEHCRYAVF